MPFGEVPDFLQFMQELSVSEDESEERYLDHNGSSEKKKWIMKAVRKPGSLGVRKWIYEMWTDFLDVLKVCFHPQFFQSVDLTKCRMPNLLIF